MRANYFWFCFLTLAAGLALLCGSLCAPAARRTGASLSSETETNRLISDELADGQLAFTARVAENKTPAESVPEWEIQFWAIANEPAWLQSQEELEELAATLTDDQIPSALEQLEQQRSEAGLVLGRVLARRWAEKSPGETARWLMQLPDNAFGQAAFRAAVIPWAEKNLLGVTDWVQQLPEGGNKQAATLALAAEAAGKVPFTSISLLTALPPGSERDQTLAVAVRQWAITDQERAISWLNQFPDLALREQMLENVVTDAGVQNPLQAATLATTILPPGPGQDRVVLNLIQFWAATDPGQAAAWVEQFPAGDLRTDAINHLIEAWGKADPDAARMWAGKILPLEKSPAL